MASITIRHLDDDVTTRLRLRGSANGRSMEEEARIILREAVERKALCDVDRRARMTEFRERTERLAPEAADAAQSDSVTLLREDRYR